MQHSKQHTHHHHASHEHHHDEHHHHHGNFKEILIKSLPLAIPIMVLSPMMGFQFPFQFTFNYSDIFVAILATILFIYGGKPFYTGAVSELQQKKPGMMALVTMGIFVSYLYSLYAVVVRYTMGIHVMDFFFEFASLILIMLLGHWIEMKAIADAGDARESLAALIPKEADLQQDDDTFIKVPVSQLQVNDVIRVQAGENIPADGIVLQGTSQVNEALLTGESKPVSKEEGSSVVSGSTNGEGTLYIKVTQIGEESFIAQVQSLVAEAQNQPSRAENLAHQVSGWLFYIALIVALISFFVWWFLKDISTGVTYAVTTLVIACPHALGLAIPLVIARSTSLGANRGLLIKDRQALELAAKGDTIILDKTGTLTTDDFNVLQIESFTQDSKDHMLGLMTGLESGSSHPIAQSIMSYSQEQNITAPSFDNVEIIKGVGIQGDYNGHQYQLISQKSYAKDLNFTPPAGATVSILLEDNRPIAAIALGDQLKESSHYLIQSLKERGIHPVLATGDNESAAKVVAESLGIDYYAEQSPEDKYHLVEQFKGHNQTVIMVGDGVNDAPSLALADVGIAIGAGTQVAIDSADIILTQSDPGDIEAFIELAQKTTRKMKENLLWGAGYNFIAIPLAAGLLAPIGFSLSPAVGAILMSLSTVIVAVNAMALTLDAN